MYLEKCDQAVVWISRGEEFIYRIPHLTGVSRVVRK